MTNLILFDIDKTLVKSSTVHGASFSAAFKKVYGIDANLDIITPSGMTDQQIITEVLRKKGLANQTIKSKLKECMRAMIEAYEKNAEKDEVVLLEGVEEVLNTLSKKGDVLGLVTGNLEPIAKKKLEKVGIDKYFSVGGFGSDDIARVNLVRLAVKRAEDKHNTKFDNILLVGDAPQDMSAGKEVGVRAIGVTTGIYTEEELKKAGAERTIENLRELVAIA